MPQRTLANELRPTNFGQVIGQSSVLASIKEQYAQKREPSAWMFIGPPGAGKTSIARVLALSLQCRHAEIGYPCEACLAKQNEFSIIEVNASDVSGVAEMEQIAKMSVYLPQPPSRRNIYILDEAQGITKAGQRLLLKYFEDSPTSTVWMVCTTEPHLILEALRRRCIVHEVRLLKVDEVTKVVNRAFKHVGSTKPRDKIIDALNESQIRSPGLIYNVLDKYFTGMPPAEAIRNILSGYDVKAICRSLEKGDWTTISKETREATSDDLRGIRAAVAGYLRAALEAQLPGPRAREFAMVIQKMAQVDSFTDATQGPATVAALYEISQIFAGPKAERRDDDVDD